MKIEKVKGTIETIPLMLVYDSKCTQNSRGCIENHGVLDYEKSGFSPMIIIDRCKRTKEEMARSLLYLSLKLENERENDDTINTFMEELWKDDNYRLLSKRRIDSELESLKRFGRISSE